MEVDNGASTSLWVFGYGSLCWHPGFAHGASAIGHIKGYLRRFWQGNTTHRGEPGKPGRVATLVEEKDGSTWGVAYELKGEEALQYLMNREVSLGGYTTAVVPFYPRDVNRRDIPSSIPVLLYVATPESKDWSGTAPLHEIATQIAGAKGPAGHNVEYLLRLAEFMREKVPEGYDEHLATLEILVRMRIKEGNMCMKTLMGGSGFDPAAAMLAEGGAAGQAEPQERRDTFQYSAKLPPKNLRCLKL